MGAVMARCGARWVGGAMGRHGPGSAGPGKLCNCHKESGHLESWPLAHAVKKHDHHGRIPRQPDGLHLLRLRARAGHAGVGGLHHVPGWIQPSPLGMAGVGGAAPRHRGVDVPPGADDRPVEAPAPGGDPCAARELRPPPRVRAPVRRRPPGFHAGLVDHRGARGPRPRARGGLGRRRTSGIHADRHRAARHPVVGGGPPARRTAGQEGRRHVLRRPGHGGSLSRRLRPLRKHPGAGRLLPSLRLADRRGVPRGDGHPDPRRASGARGRHGDGDLGLRVVPRLPGEGRREAAQVLPARRSVPDGAPRSRLGIHGSAGAGGGSGGGGGRGVGHGPGGGPPSHGDGRRGRHRPAGGAARLPGRAGRRDPGRNRPVGRGGHRRGGRSRRGQGGLRPRPLGQRDRRLQPGPSRKLHGEELLRPPVLPGGTDGDAGALHRGGADERRGGVLRQRAAPGSGGEDRRGRGGQARPLPDLLRAPRGRGLLPGLARGRGGDHRFGGAPWARSVGLSPAGPLRRQGQASAHTRPGRGGNRLAQPRERPLRRGPEGSGRARVVARDPEEGDDARLQSPPGNRDHARHDPARPGGLRDPAAPAVVRVPALREAPQGRGAGPRDGPEGGDRRADRDRRTGRPSTR